MEKGMDMRKRKKITGMEQMLIDCICYLTMLLSLTEILYTYIKLYKVPSHPSLEGFYKAQKAQFGTM